MRVTSCCRVSFEHRKNAGIQFFIMLKLKPFLCHVKTFSAVHVVFINSPGALICSLLKILQVKHVCGVAIRYG